MNIELNSSRIILFCCNSVFGMVNFRGGIMRALKNSGYRVIVVAPIDPYVEKLKEIGVEYVEWRILGRGVHPFGELRGVVRLLSLYRDIRPDIAFNFTIKPVIYGALVSRLLGVPFVSVVTGLGYVFINDNWISRLSKFLYRATLRRSLEVWLLNKDDHQVLMEQGLLANVNIRLLPGEGIDTGFFAPRSICFGSRPQFLFLARLLRDKGIYEFVEAARSLRQSGVDAEFALLGAVDADNPTAITSEELQAWQSEGIVRYLGTTQDVRPYIAAADCIVLPSYREGLPRSLLEASSMERPIIATDVPGCRDVVIDGKTGYLCESRNAKALSEAIRRVLDMSADERTLMGRRGRKFVCENFDESFVLTHYFNLIEKISK